jgi:hypothetical protein
MESRRVRYVRHRAAVRRAALFLLAGACLLAARASAQSGPTTQDGKAAAATAGKASGRASGKASGKRAASGKRVAAARLTGKARIAAEIGTASQQIRRAMVVQDTATLAELWGDEYTFTSLSGETYSKSDRLESVMSPAFVVDEAAEVLPSELDIVRVYGNVAVVQSQLAPPGTAKSGSRGGRAKLLSVWVRGSDGKWRTVAAQATAVDVPLPPSTKKKK